MVSLICEVLLQNLTFNKNIFVVQVLKVVILMWHYNFTDIMSFKI